ncbi:MAG: ester cyclase [Bacteroidota bacterium]|nr:ester cyclase [Bacteroidota bacterium]
MITEENKKIINHFIAEVINNKNLNAADEIVIESFIEHVPLPGQEQGREGLKSALRSLFVSFPDMKWMINEQIADEEKVVTRFTWTGTHSGNFMGIPPTNKSVEVWGIVIDVVRDGLFSESRIIMDNVGLLQQLGAMPK